MGAFFCALTKGGNPPYEKCNSLLQHPFAHGKHLRNEPKSETNITAIRPSKTLTKNLLTLARSRQTVCYIVSTAFVVDFFRHSKPKTL